MRTHRLVLVAALAMAGCNGVDQASPRTTSTSECPPPPAADTATPNGWLGWLAEHPDDVAMVVDPGDGDVIDQRADDPSPSASASKVLHLSAYAEAVASGRLDPAAPVTLGEWEAWYLPGLDGGAHVQALDALGLDHDGVRARDPSTVVTSADVVTAMITFSDNAAADLLRDELGDVALRAAGERLGWSQPELPSFLGQMLALLQPDQAEPSGASPADRAAAELARATEYAADPDLRADVALLAPPDIDTQLAWADTTTTADAAGLEAMHRAISTGSAGPGAEIARAALEWPEPPPGALGLGAKGGSLPGIVAEALTLRRDDGTVGSAVLLVRRMPAEDWLTATESFAHQELLLAALQDPAQADLLRCALA